jgi:hypothetical protein
MCAADLRVAITTRSGKFWTLLMALEVMTFRHSGAWNTLSS